MYSLMIVLLYNANLNVKQLTNVYADGSVSNRGGEIKHTSFSISIICKTFNKGTFKNVFPNNLVIIMLCYCSEIVPFKRKY
jgi:hypothetical protein